MTQSAFAFSDNNGISAQWCETPPFSSTTTSAMTRMRTATLSTPTLSLVKRRPSSSGPRAARRVLLHPWLPQWWDAHIRLRLAPLHTGSRTPWSTTSTTTNGLRRALRRVIARAPNPLRGSLPPSLGFGPPAAAIGSAFASSIGFACSRSLRVSCIACVDCLVNKRCNHLHTELVHYDAPNR